MHLPRYVREGGTPPLSDDPAGSGWRTVVIPTAVGDLTVRAGRRTGRIATVLLHGAAGTWTTWTPLAAYARDTGRSLESVIAVDLPGWGDSGELDPALNVKDVSHAIAALVRSLGYDDWIVVGHSLGGVVALDVAARAPGPTRGVVLVAPTGASVIDAIRRPLRGGMRLPGFAGMLAVMRALSAFGPGGAAIVEGVAAAGLLPLLTRPLFSARVDPSVVAAFRTEVRPTAFARAARMLAGYDEDAWSVVRCPVQVVRGPRDVFASPRDDVALAARIPQLRVRTASGTGHFPHVERPDAVLDAIEAIRSGG